jgi:hypothetical protein
MSSVNGIFGWSTEEWSALASLIGAVASVGTLVVAVVAVLAAFRQVKEARILREEQAQPYVVVYFEPSRASSIHFDLVVRNIGQTAAQDVSIAFEPALASTLDDDELKRAEANFLQHGIPMLPPNMEYRMLFDDGPKRYDRHDLPRRYTATVGFQARHKERQREIDSFVLDIDTFFGYEMLTIYGEHHSAKALREIASIMKRWSAHSTSGIKAYVVDEDAWQARRVEDRQRRQRSVQEHPASEASDGTETEAVDATTAASHLASQAETTSGS